MYYALYINQRRMLRNSLDLRLRQLVNNYCSAEIGAFWQNVGSLKKDMYMQFDIDAHIYMYIYVYIYICGHVPFKRGLWRVRVEGYTIA